MLSLALFYTACTRDPEMLKIRFKIGFEPGDALGS